MPRLPAPWPEHLESDTSNHLGACTPDGWPEICRALGARMLADGRIEVLVAADAGRPVLAAIEATRRVSHVNAHPVTNRVLHTKGTDAEVLPADAGHMALLLRCRRRFAETLQLYGMDENLLKQVWYDVDQPGLRCVRFTPLGAWNQTPGIGAGAAVEMLA